MAVGCTTGNAGQATPQPVSQEVYQTELRTAGDTLKAAFDGIRTAPPLEPLGSQIDSATSTVRATTQRLAAIVPPAQYGTGQADLISALDQLATQLSEVRTQVQSQELCAAPPTMATLSTLAGVDALRRAASGLGSGGANLAAALPPPEPLSDRHEKNGKVLRSPGSGKGQLKVENGTGHDASVIIARDGRAAGSFYVTRGETAQLNNIPDGTYDVFFTTGADWDGGAFTRSCAFKHADKSWAFSTQWKAGGSYTYSILSITLHPVTDGTVPIRDVPSGSFPK